MTKRINLKCLRALSYIYTFILYTIEASPNIIKIKKILQAVIKNIKIGKRLENLKDLVSKEQKSPSIYSKT